MTHKHHIIACWLLVAGYAFLVIAGHGGQHALSGDEHLHGHGLAGTGHYDHTHAHGAVDESGPSGPTSHHSHHAHHHSSGHQHSHSGQSEETPQTPPPIEHDENCLICVVLSNPVEVTAPVTIEPLDEVVGEEVVTAVVSVGTNMLPTPPVRGPPRSSSS